MKCRRRDTAPAIYGNGSVGDTAQCEKSSVSARACPAVIRTAPATHPFGTI